MKSATVIRIVKKKAVHETPHGGSWKVAYADFVTALMAFFLVMWIISMDQPVKENIQNYFNNPFSAAQSKSGISHLASGGESPIGYGTMGTMNAKNWRELALEVQKDQMAKAKKELKNELGKKPELSALNKHVEMSIDEKGLKIELIEAEDGLFFKSGSAEIPELTRELLGVIARKLGDLPNPITIEGHTDTAPYPSDAQYTNWELSADRANAARRVLDRTGVKPRQIVEVRGYADSRLRKPSQPTHFSNRRVAIVVSFNAADQPENQTSDQSSQKTRPMTVPIDLRPFSGDNKPDLSVNRVIR
jgi:chemotaxis protein MotB